MKIAFDASYIQRRRTGYGRFSLELLNGLLAFDQSNYYVLHGWSYSLDIAQLVSLRNEKVQLKLARIPGFLKRAYWNSIRMPNIERLIGDFDIFHGAEPMLPPTDKPTIATLYDLSYMRYPQFFEPIVLQWDSSVQRSVRDARRVIVPSENTKNDLVEIFGTNPDKIHVIYLPASEQFSSNRSGTEENLIKRYGLTNEFVFFAGTFEPRKNIPFIIKGFEIFHRDHQNVMLVLAGKKGWLFDEIFKEIERSPARGMIRYLNYVPDDDLAALYRSAWCFVYPSIYEGYGLPVLEAMASGTPVITSDSSSLPEIAGNAAILIDPLRMDELVDALITLYSDSVLRNDLKAKGLERTRQLSRRNAVDGVLDIYKSIVVT